MSINITPEVEETTSYEEERPSRKPVDMGMFFAPAADEDASESPFSSTTTASYSSLLAPTEDSDNETSMDKTPSRRSVSLDSMLSESSDAPVDYALPQTSPRKRERGDVKESSGEQEDPVTEEKPPKFMLTMILIVCACLLAISGLLILLSGNKSASEDIVLPEESVIENVVEDSTVSE